MPEPSIENKNTMKMLFSTLVIVIMKTFFEAVKLTTPVFLAPIGMYVLHLPTANVSLLHSIQSKQPMKMLSITITKVII